MTMNQTDNSTDHPTVEKTYFSLEEARDLFPNGKVSRASLERWWRFGVRGVVLKTYMIGCRRYTTLAAIQEFIEAQQSR